MRKAKKEKEEKKIEQRGSKRRARERKGKEKKKRDFPGVPTVGARQSENKSRSTHRELRVGTKIFKFRQAPQGREFFYFNYF